MLFFNNAVLNIDSLVSDERISKDDGAHLHCCVDRGEVRRLSANCTAIPLFDAASAAKHDRLRAFFFGHRDLCCGQHVSLGFSINGQEVG